MNEWMNEWIVLFSLKQEYFYNEKQLVSGQSTTDKQGKLTEHQKRI